ncbi:MAG: TlpA disulfide reductase family protein [Xanthomonadales bacterium]
MSHKNRSDGKWLSVLLMLVAFSANAASATDDPVDFTLPQLGGGEISISDYLGGWVVVNYWATWCAPCRKEMPELSQLHDERDDITVLGLAFEDTDEEAFAAFLTEFHASYPVLLVDVYQPPEPFGAPKVLPTTIILNTEGRAVKTFLGPVTREVIERFVDAAGLQEESVDP